jgi:NAD(P)H-dependent FMN reductase
MASKHKIGIIISTTRPNRLGDKPTEWLAELARERTDASFEVVDLRDYPLPFFEERMAPLFAPVQNPVAQRWAAKIAEFDGYVFVTAEYNHSITGVLKNALDHLYAEVQRKPATFVGYGGVGGARAVEHLRHILAEMQVATLKHAVHIGRSEMMGLLFEGKALTDYPHLAQAAGPMLDELLWWTTTLKAGRARTTS